MKTKIYLFFFLFFIFGCCSIPTHTKINNSVKNTINLNVADKIERSSVAFLDYSEESKSYLTYCAGVFVAPDLILTARHCVEGLIPGSEDPEPINITNKEISNEDILKILMQIYDKPDLNQMIGIEVPFKTFDEIHQEFTKNSPPNKIAKIIKYDENSDLALLKTEWKSDNFSLISNNNGSIGDKVHIVGHPARVEFTYFTGIISGFRTESMSNVTSNVVHITAPIYMGNSGGGAFDSNGNLIGICSFFRPAVPNMSFFVDAESIKYFLDSSILKK